MLKNILNKMDEINYGFIIDGKSIFSDSENWNKYFSEKYYLQLPEELIKTKCGVCWDQVELERYYLEKENIKCESYFMIGYDKKTSPTHTFIVAYFNNKYYWLEHSWEFNRGIYEFAKIDDLLIFVKTKFINFNKIPDNTISIYKYNKPLKNYNCNEFINYCESGIKIQCRTLSNE